MRVKSRVHPVSDFRLETLEPRVLLAADAAGIDLDDFRNDSTYHVNGEYIKGNYTDANNVRASVVVIDTGIYSAHEVFLDDNAQTRVVNGETFIDPFPDYPNPPADGEDDHGHGTFVSGILASSESTELGVVPEVNLIGIKVFDSGGGFGDDAERDLIEALEWVLDNKDTYNIVAVNMSFDHDAEDRHEMLYEQLNEAGIIVVAAAGNTDDEEVLYPASDPYTISVAASRDEDNLWGLSNGTPETIDILAPGEDITSSDAGGDDSYRTESGTSFATPHVTGAAVLAQQLFYQTHSATYPDIRLNTLDFRGLIKNNSDTIDDVEGIYDLLSVSIMAKAVVEMPFVTENDFTVVTENDAYELEIEFNERLDGVASALKVYDVTDPDPANHVEISSSYVSIVLNDVVSGAAGGATLTISDPSASDLPDGHYRVVITGDATKTDSSSNTHPVHAGSEPVLVEFTVAHAPMVEFVLENYDPEMPFKTDALRGMNSFDLVFSQDVKNVTLDDITFQIPGMSSASSLDTDTDWGATVSVDKVNGDASHWRVTNIGQNSVATGFFGEFEIVVDAMSDIESVSTDTPLFEDGVLSWSVVPGGEYDFDFNSSTPDTQYDFDLDGDFDADDVTAVISNFGSYNNPWNGYYYSPDDWKYDLVMDVDAQNPDILFNDYDKVYFYFELMRWDLNSDGIINMDDLELLAEAIDNNSTDPDYNINKDINGDVNMTDFDLLLKDIIGTLPGDSTLDGTVYLEDLAILGTYFGQSGLTWEEGDYNYDGIVNLEDLAKLATYFGQSGINANYPEIAYPTDPSSQSQSSSSSQSFYIPGGYQSMSTTVFTPVTVTVSDAVDVGDGLRQFVISLSTTQSYVQALDLSVTSDTAGDLKQLNPASFATVFNDLNPLFSSYSMDSDQDTQFMFDSDDVLTVETIESTSELQAAFAFKGDDAFTSSDVLQVVLPVNETATLNGELVLTDGTVVDLSNISIG